MNTTLASGLKIGVHFSVRTALVPRMTDISLSLKRFRMSDRISISPPFERRFIGMLSPRMCGCRLGKGALYLWHFLGGDPTNHIGRHVDIAGGSLISRQLRESARKSIFAKRVSVEILVAPSVLDVSQRAATVGMLLGRSVIEHSPVQSTDHEVDPKRCSVVFEE
jgi:hypothetical protein